MRRLLRRPHYGTRVLLTMERMIRIDVVDKNDLPISGAKIVFTVNGTPTAEVTTGNATTTFQIDDVTAIVGVSASYRSHRDSITLAQAADRHKFRFPVGSTVKSDDNFAKKHPAFVFGVAFLLIILVLVLVVKEPSPLQTRVFIAGLAIAMGGIASQIPGLLRVKMSIGKQLAITASGALAVFVILYFFGPGK